MCNIFAFILFIFLSTCACFEILYFQIRQKKTTKISCQSIFVEQVFPSPIEIKGFNNAMSIVYAFVDFNIDVCVCVFSSSLLSIVSLYFFFEEKYEWRGKDIQAFSLLFFFVILYVAVYGSVHS